MAKVVLDGVVKKFGPVTAVDDLTIEIADREFVTLEIGGTLVKARCNPDLTVRAGDRVDVAFDPAKLHLFDGKTSVSLT